MKKAIFMLGLPGSGKTTWIQNNVKIYRGNGKKINGDEYAFVSADEIRVNHPNYRQETPDSIQQECVKIAEENVYSYSKTGSNIVMDAGGINRKYTINIIYNLKSLGYNIKIVFINTPPEICISRNRKRIENNERFVPEMSIIEKSYKLIKSIEILKDVCDEFETVNYFTDKNIFVDLDGTVAEYQNLPFDENGNINFVEYEVFRHSKPVNEVINKLRKLEQSGRKIYIVSASPNSIANVEKFEWIQKHIPFIKKENIYFVGNKQYKYIFLEELMHKLKLNACDCMAIDDDHNVLLSYSKIGINAIHPSKFLSNY